MKIIVISDYKRKNWAKGESLTEALMHFKNLHKYDFKFFDADGNQNKVMLVNKVKNFDDVFVDDSGLLHYKDGSNVTEL